MKGGLLLVKTGGAAALPEWQARFAELAPDLDVRGWDDPTVDPDAVTYVLVWEPEPGRLARYPNLRVIFSSAAGVDHITCDPDLPRGVPIVRMATEETAQTMGEYVCLAALSILRDGNRLAAAQANRRWDSFEQPHTALDKRVGVMGLGNIGQVAARMLRGLGFTVSGWARTPREIDGIKVHSKPRRLAGRERHPRRTAARDAADARPFGPRAYPPAAASGRGSSMPGAARSS